MAKPVDSRSKSIPSKLGRGLGSLIPVPIQPGTAAVPASAAPSPTIEPKPSVRQESVPSVDTQRSQASAGHAEAVVFLPHRAIQPGKYQPRGSMDSAALDLLAKSIEQSGLMQPIVVRSLHNQPGRYELIAGERRWRALERLGRTEVPAIIREVGDFAAAELSLVENLQREDLNPMDRAVALRRLVDEFGVTHSQAAERVGLDRATVSNLLRLLDLDAATAMQVRQGAVSLGHAKVLLGVADVASRRRLAEGIVQNDWSVRQLEAAAREQGAVPHGTSKRQASTAKGSAHLNDLKRRLEEYLGTRVDLRLGRKKGAGELRVRFFSLDEFDGLMQRIGFKSNQMNV